MKFVEAYFSLKDYSLRARDYNEKKGRLKILRQKAADRNPDEFYYGMLSGKSKDGRKLGDRGNTSLSHDAVKLLKTQDAAYVREALQRTGRAIDKLEQEFLLKGQGTDAKLLGDKNAGQLSQEHVLFTEDLDEQHEMRAAAQNKDQALSPASDNEDSSPRKSQRQLQKEESAATELKILQKKHRKEQNARRTRLEALKIRHKDLRDAEVEMDLQRARMNHAVGGVNREGKTWRVRERKR